MARPRPLACEAQAMQIVQTQLGIDRPPQTRAHPRRHLAPAPQTAIGCGAIQKGRQRRLIRRVQKRLLAGVTMTPIAQTGQAIGVPTVHQLLDPAHAEACHPGHLRHRHPAQQQPNDLQVRATNRVPLGPIGHLHRADTTLRQ